MNHFIIIEVVPIISINLNSMNEYPSVIPNISHKTKMPAGF